MFTKNKIAIIFALILTLRKIACNKCEEKLTDISKIEAKKYNILKQFLS